MLKKLQRQISRLLRTDERGSVMIMVAGGALLAVAATGIAVDTARAQILQTKMSSALDAAGLAAGASANSGPSGTSAQAWVQQQAQKYFDANFPSGYLGAEPVTVTATLSSDKTTVTLNATTSQATSFIAVVGVHSVTVAANSTITRSSTGMELVLVLDNTGSMGDPVNSGNSSTAKIDALKSAITGSSGLLDILYGNSSSISDLWIGVVPFTDMVNIGTGHSDWMDATYDGALDFGPVVANPCPNYTGTSPSTTGTYRSSPSRCSYKLSGTAQPNWGLGNWAGCVTSRSASTTSPTETTVTLDGSDDYPSSSTSGTLFDAFYYPSTDTSLSSTTNDCTSGSNPWRCYSTSGSGNNKKTTTMYHFVDAASGPNKNCIASVVLPMTAAKSSVVSEVNGMTANGSTMINLGLSWGWRMLSPSWQGHWGGEMNATGNNTFPTLPLAYDTPLMNKVVILMTDGMNSTNSYSAYIGQATPSNTTLDDTTLAICKAMKAHNITIYTIGFGDSNSVNTDLLSKCATDTQHYFLAPTNADLAQAFSQIGDSLANLRVSK